VTDVLSVRAAVLHDIGEPLRVESVRLEPPRQEEVLVRLAAAGVCHSDLHLAEGHLGAHRRPIVLGHEGAGVVESAGEGVSSLRPGDRVALSFVAACGECRACRGGRRNLCEQSGEHSYAGTLPDGTMRLSLEDGTPLQQFLSLGCFAERCVVAATSCVPVPGALPLWQAALIGCGAVTGFGAVRNAARVRPGESVAVVGCGGVGLQVVAAAALAGADPIVAVDLDAAKLELALARGATLAVDASRVEPGRRVLAATGGGVDHAFEVVGRPETIRLAWDVLRSGGTATVVGLAPREVEACVPAIEFLSEKSLRGSFYGSGDPVAEIAELAGLVVAGRFTVGDVVSHFTDLDGIEEAFSRLRRGEGARTVVVLDHELAGPLP
jgi:S-(hydroxymethyl)glutathione dehydrogenase/alcohol dehydrogenase